MITILFEVLDDILRLYWWIVILAAIFSTLAAFNVLDTRNRLVWTIGDFLYRATEPALRPIRRVLPHFGNLDFSPLVLLLIIYVIREILIRLHIALITGDLNTLIL